MKRVFCLVFLNIFVFLALSGNALSISQNDTSNTTKTDGYEQIHAEKNTLTAIEDGVYHQTRLAAVICGLLAGNIGAMFTNMVASLGDYYYRPSFHWGTMSILFMHITPFLIIYSILGFLIRDSKIISKFSTTFKCMIYFISLPLLVLFMTLIMPSV